MQPSIDSTVADIRMRRSVFKGPFLIVEGHSDGRLFESILDGMNVNVIDARGKKNVLYVVQTLQEEGFGGVLGIVDRDFDAILGTLGYGADIIPTDYHDLELMMIRSPALAKVLGEFGSTAKLESARASWNREISDFLVETAAEIGLLRLVSHRHSLGLDFADLAFGALVDRRTLSVDVPSLVQRVLNKSQRHDLTVQWVLEAIDRERAMGHHLSMLAQGHDVLEILSIALRRILGSQDEGAVKGDVLERSLRLALERRHFEQTELYNLLIQWQSQNQDFCLLA